EGIVTTINADRLVNVAPMGPIVDASMQSIVLRPFKTSTTYANLKQNPFGVLHVTDDSLLFAKTAIGCLKQLPKLLPATMVNGSVLADACRWYEFEVTDIDDVDDRTTLTANIVHDGRLRDFFGFNRAKHAVLEMAILATRLHILDCEDVVAQYKILQRAVDKTGGTDETRAAELLQSHLSEYMANTACAK
ncbi:DUF447 family protein, partial [bacterium]|nr:DUF447 family protein [bacterium]